MLSGLFLTECLSTDTFKTEYATRQLKSVEVCKKAVVAYFWDTVAASAWKDENARKTLSHHSPSWGARIEHGTLPMVRRIANMPPAIISACSNIRNGLTIECNQTQMHHRELTDYLYYPVHLQFTIMRCDVFDLLFDSPLFFSCMPQRHRCQPK